MNPYSSKKQSPDAPPPLTTPGEKATPIPAPKPPAQEQKPSGSISIPPEAVSFRTSDQVCESCTYMQQDGMCSALNMAVEAKDGCDLHQSGGSLEADVEGITQV